MKENDNNFIQGNIKGKKININKGNNDTIQHERREAFLPRDFYKAVSDRLNKEKKGAVCAFISTMGNHFKLSSKESVYIKQIMQSNKFINEKILCNI